MMKQLLSATLPPISITKLDDEEDTETDEHRRRLPIRSDRRGRRRRTRRRSAARLRRTPSRGPTIPVRMYLTQMGEIPLLTRKEEISLARRIEITRAAFRRKLLACDYVIRSAVKVLNRVHRGELPFDRTVQVSVTDRLEKDQILGRLPLQPGHARAAAGAQRRRLPRRHQQDATSRRSAVPPGTGSAAAAAGPCCWSKSSACAPSGSSR